jgi:hypothetical protein
LWILLRWTWVCKCFYLLYPDLYFFWYMPISSITGSDYSSVSGFLRNLHTAFHSDCAFPPKCIMPPPPTFVFVLWIIAVPTGVRWNLNVVLFHISFMVRDVEHFMYLLAACTYSFENFCLVHLPTSSLGHWIFGSLGFWLFFFNFYFLFIIFCSAGDWI